MKNASAERIRTRGDVFLADIVGRLTRMGSLPRRMAEALSLHVRGWPPAVAAEHMGCSRNTYRNHLASAFERIGAEAPNELFRVIARDLDEASVGRGTESPESSERQ